MNKFQPRKIYFLLELLISILLFIVLLVVGLQFFMKSYTLTNKTRSLHEAVNLCENLSSIYEGGNGDFSAIKEAYPIGEETLNSYTIRFDENFRICTPSEAYYYAQVKQQSSHDRLKTVTIRFYDNDNQLLHSIEAYHYSPLEGGAD